ncbi:MAG TPA: F0F1 ATP synthase subunit A [Gemmatimonadales bacterium]|nr:F0F1 ATP synthase subunit A [Gemmatimonadales bacterium]
MMRFAPLVLAASLLGSLSSPLQAQAAPVEKEAFEAAQGTHVQSEREIDIMEHLANKNTFEYPCLKPSYICEVPLPRFAAIHLGPITLDFSVTKHFVFLVLSAIIVSLVFILSGLSIRRAQAAGRPPKGFAGAMEAMALYLRQEVILPNVGEHGEGYVPYLLTTFFFILVCNLFGLVPYMGTATGNIAVTGGLALLAFLVIEISGMITLGFSGYMHTIFFLPPGLPGWIKPLILVIMTPIELIGKLAKPFALAVRLFANMTAGHALVLALIGLIFTFHSWAVGVGASLMSTAIMCLEVFVAFLQAYVFTLLTAVFIGLMRAEH